MVACQHFKLRWAQSTSSMSMLTSWQWEQNSHFIEVAADVSNLEAKLLSNHYWRFILKCFGLTDPLRFSRRYSLCNQAGCCGAFTDHKIHPQITIVTPNVASWLFCTTCKGCDLAPSSGTDVNVVCKHVVNVCMMATPFTVTNILTFVSNHVDASTVKVYMSDKRNILFVNIDRGKQMMNLVVTHLHHKKIQIDFVRVFTVGLCQSITNHAQIICFIGTLLVC